MTGNPIFASKAKVGGRYVTKGGYPVVMLGMQGSGALVRSELTGREVRISDHQLLWPYKDSNISKEAITMAKGTKAKKHPKQSKAPAHHAAGGKLEREYKGKTHVVEQTAEGFLYDGKTYSSLSAVAKEITGYKAISGPAFFGTAKAKKEPVAA